MRPPECWACPSRCSSRFRRASAITRSPHFAGQDEFGTGAHVRCLEKGRKMRSSLRRTLPRFSRNSRRSSVAHRRSRLPKFECRAPQHRRIPATRRTICRDRKSELPSLPAEVFGSVANQQKPPRPICMQTFLENLRLCRQTEPRKSGILRKRRCPATPCRLPDYAASASEERSIQPQLAWAERRCWVDQSWNWTRISSRRRGARTLACRAGTPAGAVERGSTGAASKAATGGWEARPSPE